MAGLAGVRFPRGFMLAAQVVYALGFAFATWLFFESLFVIGAVVVKRIDRRPTK